MYGPGERQTYIITYVYKGQGILRVAGNTYTITAGQSFIVYPGVTVQYYPDDGDPWEYCWVDFKGETSEALIKYAGFELDKPVLPPTDGSSIAEIFKEFADIHHTESTNTYKMLLESSCFYRLIAEYCKIYSQYAETENPQNLLGNIIAYISVNYGNPDLSPDTLAEHFKISRSSLFRIFKSKLHTTPKKYINRIRIENACVMLHSNDKLIKEVAILCGFTDPLYFSKVFTAETGINPSLYYYIKTLNREPAPKTDYENEYH